MNEQKINLVMSKASPKVALILHMVLQGIDVTTLPNMKLSDINSKFIEQHKLSNVILSKHLERLKTGSQWLFPGMDGNQITLKNLAIAIRNVCKKCEPPIKPMELEIPNVFTGRTTGNFTISDSERTLDYTLQLLKRITGNEIAATKK